MYFKAMQWGLRAGKPKLDWGMGWTSEEWAELGFDDQEMQIRR